jgi:short-subunit dehydrogenase
MRNQRNGRIINISSIAGRLSTPVNGTYSATKFALEALSDALRLELAPFGVQVIVIEPGAIKTHFDDTAQAHAESILSNSGSPYWSLYEKSHQFAAGMRQNEPGAECVSKTIQQALEAPHPRSRYLAAVPFSGKLVLQLRDFVWDFALRQIFKIQKPSLPDRSLPTHLSHIV